MSRWASDRERDAYFMQEALAEARKGQGRTSPNPLVGCVIVQDDQIIGRGHHARAGCAHAEAAALASATADVHNAEVYVTLEPCAHHGRTPPCAQALRDSGVHRVVAGMIDPDPRVQGRGMAILAAAGIATEVGVLREECEAINEAFIVQTRHRRPHVLVKLAGTLDGRIATASGDSKWITNSASRHRVHELRNEVDAIVIGAGTALADQPQLTTRLEGVPDTRSPHRYLLDSQLRVPAEGPLFDTTLAPTTVVCVESACADRQAAIEATGVTVIRVEPDAHGRVALPALLEAIGDAGHMRVLVEGGAELAGAFFDHRLVDRLMLFVAPLLLGGRDAKPLVGGEGVDKVADALRATSTRWEGIEGDLLVHAVFDASLRA